MRFVAMHRILRYAAYSGIVSLGLLIWGLFDPQPIASVVALTVGQALGGAALLAFLAIVIADLRRRQVFPTADEEREDSLPRLPLPRRGSDDGRGEEREP